MSKASDWSEGYSQRPEIVLDHGDQTGSVSNGGSCVIKNGNEAVSLRPVQALRLAQWILDTFGETMR